MTETPSIRLFVDSALEAGAAVQLDRGQSHYLVNVMRQPQGAGLLLFNGRDGEWLCEIAAADKKATVITVMSRTREQDAEPDVWLAFAPLKKDRTDFLIEKATELGVRRLLPVTTQHTQSARLRTDRLHATAIEAAEQSRRLSVPAIAEPASLDRVLADWPAGRRLVYLDETGTGAPLAAVLAEGHDALGFLIGPEGGFSRAELDALRNLTFSVAADLGPRILRAETAATAALAIRQSIADLNRN
ncbi:MAG: 16S rRNA (uracil(1498)-N(3))-methyltransferase [Rhodospirillales bacterium]|nr:16S rRNA (uracil(1498)-N(3))-methyltransferase [Rhodospirillales bacterium]MBO6788628.1 16S rRNA (uracil(1498)-N(3))-methyltransferase [Rhodospirillales bacterium]